MNNKDRYDLKNCNNVLIKSNDPKFNFNFYKSEDIEDFNNIPNIIDLELYDYSYKADEGDELNLPKLISNSLLLANENLEKLEEFYRNKFPNLPDEYHGIIARYSSGTLYTKKEAKNAIKKYKKNNNQIPIGLKVSNNKNPFLVEFK